MGGGLMQLVAYGAQDIYLTGNPQITFFKVVYRRHTNFSMECIEQTFNGTKAFGSNVTATISRNGDLVSGLYVTFNPRLVCGTIAKKLSILETAHNVGFGLIEQVDIEIGGQRIDRQFGKWMNVWSDLTRKNYSNNKGGLVYPGEIAEGPTQNQSGAFEASGGAGASEGTTPDAGCVYQNVVDRGYLETNHQGVQGRSKLSAAGITAAAAIAGSNPGDGSTDATALGAGAQDTVSSDGDVQGYGVPTQFQRTSFNIGSSRVVTAATDVGTAVGVDVGYASVPLDFWFCRNPGLALPLIALQYHEVKINLTITGRDKLVNVGRQAQGGEVLAPLANVATKPPAGEFASGGSPEAGSISLWADYIYLDTDERRRFAQVSHEYLIEQVQYISNPPSSSKTINLNFNHPVKELIWCGAPNDTPLSNTLNIDSKISGSHDGVPPSAGLLMDTGAGRTGGDAAGGVITLTEGAHQFNSDLQTYRPDGLKMQCGPSVPTPLAIDDQANLLSEQDDSFKWTIKLNGHERFAPRHPRYFTDTQIANHHTGSSGIFHEGSISVYSFALKPEEHQPSGTCNFSRIDNAQLVLSGSSSSSAFKLCSVLPTKGMDIYAVNYNVLRIMSGMGGLAYSN